MIFHANLSASVHSGQPNAPFIWSRVPETTLPRVTLGKLTFPCVVVKFKQPFVSGGGLSRVPETT